MASFHVEGLTQLSAAFEDIAILPDEVIDEMLLAEAEVVEKAQRRTASTMLQGPYYKGGVAGAVSIGRPQRSRDGRSVKIEFKGTQHGESLARIAYINEFGKHGQPGRPFIAFANEQAADEAVSAAERIYDNYLKSKNL